MHGGLRSIIIAFRSFNYKSRLLEERAQRPLALGRRVLEDETGPETSLMLGKKSKTACPAGQAV
jgi:hypothetical protein